jgi:hypothetical protein
MSASAPAAAPTPARWPRLGAWCFVVVGAVHLLVLTLKLSTPLPPAELAVLARMGQVEIDGLGVQRSLAQLYYGFSATMGLLALGLGVVLLLVARRAPALLASGSALGRLSFALAAAAFAIALVAFPTPPVVLLGVATVAFGGALRPWPD